MITASLLGLLSKCLGFGQSPVAFESSVEKVVFV
jgi:hypothetical protein